MQQTVESDELAAYLEAEDNSDMDSSSNAFWEQDDVVSEILSFLDAPSLLNMCRTTKKATSLLRYQHVFGAAKRRRRRKNSHSSSMTIANRSSHNKNSYSIILDKLAKVYNLHENTVTNAVVVTNLKWTKRANIVTTNYNMTKRPSPLRLLQLVNGKKCERCHRDLSPCVFAGRSGFGTGVLPSLSFGEFCCTLCIFDKSSN